MSLKNHVIGILVPLGNFYLHNIIVFNIHENFKQTILAKLVLK